MIKIEQITPESPLYTQEVQLREDVLLRPIGLTIDTFKEKFPGVEERFEHFVAVFDHPSGPRVVGCGTLLKDAPEPGMGRIMQMSVHPQRRGEGIGKKLIIAIERRVFADLGLEALCCHAQLTAISFYESLGWSIDSDTFEEAGIAHKRMIFRASPVSTPPSAG